MGMMGKAGSVDVPSVLGSAGFFCSVLLQHTEGGNGSEAAKTRDWWTKGVSVDGGMS